MDEEKIKTAMEGLLGFMDQQIKFGKSILESAEDMKEHYVKAVLIAEKYNSSPPPRSIIETAQEILGEE